MNQEKKEKIFSKTGRNSASALEEKKGSMPNTGEVTRVHRGKRNLQCRKTKGERGLSKRRKRRLSSLRENDFGLAVLLRVRGKRKEGKKYLWLEEKRGGGTSGPTTGKGLV